MGVTLQWVGGEHEFALQLGQLRKLQDACDAGPEEIMRRVVLGNWRVNDLFETIRLGLIGSGAMDTGKAGPFVTTLFEQHPLIEFKVTAQAILIHALTGPEDDALGEPEGETTKSQDGGSSAPSTTPAE